MYKYLGFKGLSGLHTTVGLKNDREENNRNIGKILRPAQCMYKYLGFKGLSCLHTIVNGPDR